MEFNVQYKRYQWKSKLFNFTFVDKIITGTPTYSSGVGGYFKYYKSCNYNVQKIQLRM